MVGFVFVLGRLRTNSIVANKNTILTYRYIYIYIYHYYIYLWLGSRLVALQCQRVWSTTYSTLNTTSESRLRTDTVNHWLWVKHVNIATNLRFVRI